MPGRQLVWAEDFTGPPGSAPDGRTWTAELGGGGWGCGQLQRYTDSLANAAVDDDGRLAITARGTPASDGDITSARLVTQQKVGVRHGRVEARIKVPAGRGVWPAFWMLGTDIGEVGWPGCGEIDVMEYVGSEPTTVHGTLHGPGYAGLAGGVGHAHETGVDLAADFHVYGIDWTPDSVTWHLDGQAYNTITPADVPGSWPFDHDFYLLVNLAVGGDWPGNEMADPAHPPLPATMLVDWIRVYDGTVTRAGQR